MIEININGRLGNQMFQYAFARALQEKKNGEPINLCFKNMKGTDGFVNSLQYFNVNPFFSYDKIHPSFVQKLVLILFNLLRKVLKINYQNRWKEQLFELKYQRIFNFFGIYWLTQGYYDFPIRNTKSTILIGYFESSKYFEAIKEQIKKEFVPVYPKIEINLGLYEKIESTESVCITIRRGDYVSNEQVKKSSLICTEHYFYKAIKLIQEKVTNPVFFIFSDDVEFVKNNMNFESENVFFESGNDPLWEKLRLMYSCKHFIISNSTFSWWAQYLSKNENKIVIAPSRWRNYKCKLDIYEPNWILINPD
jgi:hypothetical protein